MTTIELPLADVLYKREDIDDILGEFQARMYDFTDHARAKGDMRAEAVGAYLHDQLCVYRRQLLGESIEGQKYAPDPLAE